MTKPTPRVNVKDDLVEQVTRLLADRDLTRDFINLVADLFIAFFDLGLEESREPRLRGYGQRAPDLAARALAHLAGYEWNDPPFSLHVWTDGVVELRWDEGRRPAA